MSICLSCIWCVDFITCALACVKGLLLPVKQVFTLFSLWNFSNILWSHVLIHFSTWTMSLAFSVSLKAFDTNACCGLYPDIQLWSTVFFSFLSNTGEFKGVVRIQFLSLLPLMLFQTFMQHKKIYFKECFNWFCPYNDSQWGPKQHWLYGKKQWDIKISSSYMFGMT